MKNYRRGQITNSPLNEVSVRSMRWRHSQGLASTRELAAECGLATESVRKILRRETWAWVSDEGAGAGDYAPPVAADDIAASEARLLASLAEAPRRGEVLLDELAGHGNVAVVGSPNGATPDPTDGGTK